MNTDPQQNTENTDADQKYDSGPPRGEPGYIEDVSGSKCISNVRPSS